MKKDFLAITDLSREEILQTFELTSVLKEKTRRREAHPILAGHTLAMIFAKPSARTRISFETGMFQLGGHALYLSPQDIGIGKREAIKDIARVISRYNDLIMARLFDHAHIEELARFASVPVINGLTDYNHPCQIMADAFTILEQRGRIEDLKIVFIGDGNNVAHSWINFAARIPIHLVICTPPGYEPDEKTVQRAREAGLSRIELTHDPREAVQQADVLYTDVWASMGQEQEAEQRKKIFQPYQLNMALVKLAGPDVLVMHCLPAHRGEEITDEVMESEHAIVFDEAENRLHVQKAIMVKLLGKEPH
ncbi:MAG: ornithine carbamoyltransferase [Calditrichaeota bacterium]|nr:MAG: ornithine carbamoyltransferase [Calditrichota bacterium]